MADVQALEVRVWGATVGALAWDAASGCAEFQYSDAFVRTGIELSPLMMPLSHRVYRFPELARSATFLGLPGMLADALPEKYGNELMGLWLARRGLQFSDLTPVERLCYLGQRGMGALEFEPDLDASANEIYSLRVPELVQVARAVLAQHYGSRQARSTGDRALHQLIQIGTSAGGAKAKAIIAVNEVTHEVISGQADCPPGFEHWLLKFADVDNEEHETSRAIGRIELAYHYMAVEAGIEMMQSAIELDGDTAHFKTRRFDRVDGQKLHVQSFSAIAHQDRNPAGNTDYETLFTTARRLGLGQRALDELYLRMVFNIAARNHDDHAKNHAFMMAGQEWRLTPAYDLCFSYKKESRWIDQHQMRCNGKRDNFVRGDLLQAARSADVRNAGELIAQVGESLHRWPEWATKAGLSDAHQADIERHFRWDLLDV